MSIEGDIKSWNGKSVDDLHLVLDRYRDQPAFVSTILRSSEDPGLETAATWLLKQYLESAGAVDSQATDRLCRLLPQLQHWQSRLHVLQSLPYIDLPGKRKKTVEKFLRECLGDEQKFIRAWAYSGFYELARQYPEYRPEMEKLFESAIVDEAPSVKARIRRILTQGY